VREYDRLYRFSVLFWWLVRYAGNGNICVRAADVVDPGKLYTQREGRIPRKGNGKKVQNCQRPQGESTQSSKLTVQII